VEHIISISLLNFISLLLLEKRHREKERKEERSKGISRGKGKILCHYVCHKKEGKEKISGLYF
jgi:hypothetical protein